MNSCTSPQRLLPAMDTWVHTSPSATVKQSENKETQVIPENARVIIAEKNLTYLGELGKGGFSNVLRVLMPNGIIAALKVPKSEEKFKNESFALEAELQQKVHDMTKREHGEALAPEVYDAGVNPYFPTYLLMQDMTGFGKLEGVKLGDVEKSLIVLRNVLRATTALHKLGYHHGDLKRGNTYGQGIVGDFGSAAKASQGFFANRKNQIEFTFAYASPEQLRFIEKEHQDSRLTDVFSSGILGFELICGYSPFNINNGLGKKRLKKPMRIREYDPFIAEGVEELFNDMLNYHPKNRIDLETTMRRLDQALDVVQSYGALTKFNNAQKCYERV